MNALLRAISALTLVTAVGTAHAVDYKNEFDKKVKATQNIGALGDNLAGDSVNFYNGVTSFSATDASLPGNNALSVAVSRRYDVEFDHDPWRPFGDWELDLPYITTVMSNVRGWVVGPSGSTSRCNVSTIAEATPPMVEVPEDTGKDKTHWFFPFEYWHGYTLHLPGGGDQALLLAGSGAPQSGPDITYRWTTNKDWWLSCIPAVTGGGEGFLALAPDGTKYTFNRAYARGTDASVKTVNDEDGPNPGGQYLYFTLDRAEFRMMPSRVEDRFGNWVEYDWIDGQLRKIRSSDLREITLSYYPNSHLVQFVTDGTRTWTYTYDNGALNRVTESDQKSYWEYNFAAVNALRRPEPACFANLAQPNFDCYGGGFISAPPPTVATVRHPSGALASFTFEVHFQPSNSSGFYGYYPLSLKEKSISGPGLTAATWKYGFSPTMDQTRTACRAGTCPHGW